MKIAVVLLYVAAAALPLARLVWVLVGARKQPVESVPAEAEPATGDGDDWEANFDAAINGSLDAIRDEIRRAALFDVALVGGGVVLGAVASILAVLCLPAG